MDGDTLVFSEFYQWFEVQVFATPDADLWDEGYYHCIYDSNGIERLDGSEYEPKDFLHRDMNDAIAGAKFQIERYWKFGGNWYPSDQEVQEKYHTEAIEQGYRI